MSNNLYLPWPYAAKAIIEYQPPGDNTYVWITFREPMNILVMPGLTKWKFRRDGSLEYPVSTSWLDHFTLYCVIDVQDTFTDLTCEYLGAGPAVYKQSDPLRKTLETTWGKQWEPWGPIPCHNINA